ncbi:MULTISPECIES: hypothetical protein [Paraburkholderia]|uniref:hypothetical protein n=1 Tax=Paraburkholderia TaxID=1822464 RepID=UPI002257F406|nr:MULTISPECIES: hypothetical protein [Paraburkholderia]MCX4171726.1 hypothetical protein [Paraburkholderia madseniana]MDQ6459735.1 hypothetical protein [Paraburkholderia madseniana]
MSAHLAEQTTQIVRNVASRLRPAALNFGLASALEWLAGDFTRHTHIPCHFNVTGSRALLRLLSQDICSPY